jgi:hypothetical protein
VVASALRKRTDSEKAAAILCSSNLRLGMGPPGLHERGHFYFAQTGHSHFAPTQYFGSLDRRGALYGAMGRVNPRFSST